MKKLKRLRNRVLTVTLSLMITINFSPNLVAPFITFQTLQVKAIGEEGKENFSEKHPILIKVLKYIGIIAGIVTTTPAVYYGGGFVMDKINPKRVQDRNERKRIIERVEEMKKKILEFDMGNRDKISYEEVKILRESVASLDLIINSGNSSNNDNNNNSFKCAVFGAAGLGGLVTTIKCIMDLVTEIGKFSKDILNISSLRWAVGNFSNIYQKASKLLKPPPKMIRKENVFEQFDILFKSLYGQSEAVELLKSLIYDIVVAKDQAKWRKEKYSVCNIIYMYGPSGVGKSFIAKSLSNVLLDNFEPLIISSSDVNKENEESVVDQLFNSASRSLENSEIIIPEKPIVEYLKNSPGGGVIFEEYDKVCTPALDEVFRTVIEQGTINIYGKKIDCSGTTFIFTSNEDDISMEGFEQTDSNKLDKLSVDEGYTRVWHSRSFLNRIKKVKFKNLAANVYTEIIKDHFDKMAEYWEDPRNAGVKLNISHEVIEELAKQVEKMSQGARPIDLWIIPCIQMAIGKKIRGLMNCDSYKNKSLNINYDSKNKVFSIYES